MVFNNKTELETYIKDKLQNSILQAQKYVYELIDKFVKQYYSEFDPAVYHRTYQLYRSLVKSEIKSTANGYEADIYFDLGRLKYGVGHNWSEEQVLSSAAHGSHGGWTNGTAIYDDPRDILNAEAISVFKNFMKQNGIPVI